MGCSPHKAPRLRRGDRPPPSGPAASRAGASPRTAPRTRPCRSRTRAAVRLLARVPRGRGGVPRAEGLPAALRPLGAPRPAGARGVVEGAQHARDIAYGGLEASALGERTGRLALEVDDGPRSSGPQHLPQVEVAVNPLRRPNRRVERRERVEGRAQPRRVRPEFGHGAGRGVEPFTHRGRELGAATDWALVRNAAASATCISARRSSP